MDPATESLQTPHSLHTHRTIITIMIIIIMIIITNMITIITESLSYEGAFPLATHFLSPLCTHNSTPCLVKHAPSSQQLVQQVFMHQPELLAWQVFMHQPELHLRLIPQTAPLPPCLCGVQTAYTACNNKQSYVSDLVFCSSTCIQPNLVTQIQGAYTMHKKKISAIPTSCTIVVSFFHNGDIT